VRLHIAFVSIGSNLGDPLENCRRAVDRLAALAQVRVTGRSRLYRTAPVGYTEQGWFVNQVVRVETELGPEALLARLQEIECELGKTPPAVRFGPRVIDLDILLLRPAGARRAAAWSSRIPGCIPGVLCCGRCVI
jgi:2-amino-4-hydroxy-6-hydroxymethyldihydropteridine diphosphokinase